MRRISLLLFVVAIFISSIALGQLKKRVAVSRFEDRTGSGYNHIGSGVADMLTTALVKTGKFNLIERQELDKVLDEQKLGASGLVTAESAPKVGKLLGVELLVIGSISEFGKSESKISGGFSLIGGGIKHTNARAVVDIRLVNTVTGEIVAAEKEEGEESSTGLAVRYEDIDFDNTSSWDNTDIGKACRKAVDGCVDLIVKNMAKIPFSGKILKVNADGTLLMKPGSESGVSVGQEFDIFRLGEPIKDPDTGLELGAEETKVGHIKVTEDILKGKASKAQIVSGTNLQANDIVHEVK